jgi:hypothetical protein
MDPKVMWTIVAVVIVIAAVAVGWMMSQRRRTAQLRSRFRGEYDRTVQETGDVRKAEASLAARARRVEKLQIRPLSREDADRFASSWQRVQGQFVDDPRGAITEADRLVGEVMTARGYPVGDFDQRVEDISVDHPDVVMNYRAARDIAGQHSRGQASTEDLRQAMVHYRALFRELLERVEAPAPDTKATTTATRGR